MERSNRKVFRVFTFCYIVRFVCADLLTIGILLRAKQEGYPIDIKEAIHRMIARRIRLSDTLINFALQQAGELDD
ncbi:MAG: DUF3368 domain-containing protein [Nodularia sp. (in: Bacteria)]|nr:MAG: DUF3368 domain-containing protein [Nodularia sp. (in: cyanobacteria)]